MWIDKKRLNDELTAWVMNGKMSKMPEYVGISAYKITNKILSMPSFRNYTETWLDSMKSAGVEHCIMAAQKFNPTLSNKNVNAFSLMWTYGLRGVVNALKAEKRQSEIREDFTQHAISLGIITTQDLLDAESK